jgi:hypothetical protein
VKRERHGRRRKRDDDDERKSEEEMNKKNGVFWYVTPCGCCKNRRFGGINASFIRVTRNGELGTTLAIATDACC